MKPSAPLLLSQPGRYAGWRAAPARIVLGGLVAASTAMALLSGRHRVEAAPLDGRVSDLALYQAIAHAIRGGGTYYVEAAEALRAGGYPLRPFLAFRLPTLATLQGWLPEWSVSALAALLVIAVALGWGWRLRGAVDRPIPLAIALILLAGGMVTALQAGLLYFHEIWAGLLIALSLALRTPGRWLDSVALGLAAMLMRETAAAYALLMLVMAWREGARREAAAWLTALALFAAVLGVHAWAVSGVTGPLDARSPGWLGLNGPAFASGALANATALVMLPPWLSAIVLTLALFGWSVWRHPSAARAGLMLLGYGVMLAVFARGDTFYWALIAAPLALMGLVFVPDGIATLIAAALDRRAVTVTKVVR